MTRPLRTSLAGTRGRNARMEWEVQLEEGGVTTGGQAGGDFDITGGFAQLFGRMRGEARQSLMQFLMSADQGFGGTLVIQAPCKARRRDLPEAGYRSERWMDLQN